LCCAIYICTHSHLHQNGTRRVSNINLNRNNYAVFSHLPQYQYFMQVKAPKVTRGLMTRDIASRYSDLLDEINRTLKCPYIHTMNVLFVSL